MVKLSLLFISAATIFASVSAQDQLPSDLVDIAKSVLANPTAIQSALSYASANVASLPTQYQASAQSALAAASKSLDSVTGKPTGTSAGTANKPMICVVAAAAAAAAAVVLV